MKKRAKDKYQLAPRTSSIAFAAIVVYVFGAIFFLVGAFFLVSVFIPSGVFIMFGGTTYERGVFALLSLILLCGGGLWAAHDLRRMEKTAAVLALLLCLMVICFSAAILDPRFSRHFLRPDYLNLIWWWPLPIAVIIIIWRNWGKMQWRAEMREFFGETAKKEKEGSEEL